MTTDPAASRPGTHLDPDRLADLFEGLLKPAAANEARAHLASCPLCSADFALIAGEADLVGPDGLSEFGALGDLLPPAPIPQDVVVRIEAALHREPPLNGASATASTASAAIPAARPRRRRFRITLGALAGATLVVAGGIGVVTALNSGSSGSSVSSKSNSAVAGRAPASEPGDSSHAAGRAPNGGAMSPQLGVPDPGSTGPQKYSDASIVQQAQNLLAEHVQTPAAGSTEANRLPCTPTGVVDGTRLLASTQTEYQSQPAWLMIYARSGSTTVADVYVVDLNACTPGIPGQVAYHFTIPRS